ncbi:ATP-dependent protease ClpP, protease subunit [Paracoccus aminovorans]|uniref:ATP-dependent Clp protease proteolytic subunit n=1 Tax=Paracoccus aminovorans TaxID=34004 RepID=A0A1I3FFW5_9RHOB|nr:head maturation protease, ClpP-related [Paracoccus aminovorans]CQR85987.1 ATP-dependent Clp protease proteolytic subunit (Endopeptidase Clp) [Paracoccus aminovorans]SFI10118.1 ATP-dependent protease ClpP, protease subunit [Paracoccus aminovorans]
MASWYAIRARGTGAEVAIYDEIGAYGVSAKGFLAELGALPEGTPVDLRLNSPGGSVFDAVAIHNALKRHEGTITVWIDGIAASAASYIAMAGDEIVMPENAFLMIHDPAGLVMGTAEDMRAMAEALDKVKGSLVSGYAAKSGRSAEEVSALMAAETWFGAADAVAQGFADRLIEPVRIAAAFDIGRFRNAPPVLVEAIEAEPEPDDESDGTNTEATDDADQVEDAEDEQAAASEAPQPPAETLPPSGAPPDPAAIRAQAIGHARAVVDLCRLAGHPQMAGRFLEQNASLDEVRAALLAAKAEAEPEIAPHHPQPGRSSAARPWGEIVARTFKLKG